MPHAPAKAIGASRPPLVIAELKPPKVKPDAPAARAIQVSLEFGVRRLNGCDLAARRGIVEGVHRMRTSTRQLRSKLRTFRGMIDPDWAKPLEDELKWLARSLGAVRDLDVLRDRLQQAAGTLSHGLGPLFRDLDQRHADASRALREAMQSDRYRRLLDQLDEAAAAPVLCDAAEQPCREALPPLVGALCKSLRKRARKLESDPSAESFHEVRKRAKRLRYAAESVADALDPGDARDAVRFARRANAVQDILGAHQDGIVAVQEIERITAAHPDDGPFNLAAGRLLEREARAVDEARAGFFPVWERFDRKKNLRWLGK